MPLYVYQVIEPDGTEGEVFEVLQDLSEPPLTQHPETGRPVQRLLGMPSTLRRFGPAKLSDRNLEQKGFTRYERRGKGTYEKTTGVGPRVITRGG